MAALQTRLHAWHVSHGARMITFGGWEMPLQFTGIVEEHLAVRSAAGLFDVSHMGKLLVTGDGAHGALERLSTNDIPATPGRARYTHLLDEGGRILDDVIVTCLAPDRFLCVCNAGPRPRVVRWIQAHLEGPRLQDLTETFLCLALQGPRAPEILARVSPAVPAIKPFGASEIRLGLDRTAIAAAAPEETEGWGSLGGPPAPNPPTPGGPAALAGVPVLVTRTGYTGEVGFELFPPSALAVPAWSALLAAGADLGIRPAGLGARDTLRLEKGYLLSGQDFTGRETSLETSSESLVKWGHEFVGREALRTQETRGGYRCLLGLRLLERGIPRPGCDVLHGDREVGIVTSGTMSPSLRVGIALAYLEPAVAIPGTDVAIVIRGEAKRATVVKPPFL